MDPLNVSEVVVHDAGMGGWDDRDVSCDGEIEFTNGTGKCKECETVVAETCGECDETYSKHDWENEGMYGDLTNKSLCYSCYEQDTMYPSTLVRYLGGERERVIFGDHTAYGEEGESPDWFTGMLPADWEGRTYKRTDAWRGYYDTKFPGTAMIENGWVTGDYDDVPWKRDIHTFGEALERGDIVTDFPLFMLFEPTSNVFSTAIEIFVNEDDLDRAKEFFSSLPYDLHRALS